MKYATKFEAARAWVSSFFAIPTSVIVKLYEFDEDDLEEVTPISVGQQVYSYMTGYTGTVVTIDTEEQTCVIDDDGRLYTDISLDEVIPDEDTRFPMWGTMWAFSERPDDYWMENEDGLRLMADCGFRIYKSEDYGYVFGIDGAGYDFYEAHWIPLYDARGLKWHEQ